MTTNLLTLNLEFEKAVRLLVQYASISDEKSRKPIVPHDIRVGVYLYQHGYSRDIVLAGILHDMVEFTEIGQEEIKQEFGENVLKLILANTKNDSIADKQEKTDELIQRCTNNGQDALIVKTADIIDSYKFYTAVNKIDELEYCNRNAKAIFKFKPADFDDKIFGELKWWLEK